MNNNSQQWVYNALVGMLLLLAGWLWQMVGVLRDDIHSIESKKADLTEVAQYHSDPWTGSQQIEYKKYVEARLDSLERQIKECRK